MKYIDYIAQLKVYLLYNTNRVSDYIRVNLVNSIMTFCTDLEYVFFIDEEHCSFLTKIIQYEFLYL